MAVKKPSWAGIEYLKRLRRHAAAKKTGQARPFAIEGLEDRVLPSGISPFAVKKASFLDADGDKVSIKAKGDLIQVALLGGATNNADVASVSIVPGKLGVYDPAATIDVNVKQGKTGLGTTQIAEMTMLDLGGTEQLAGITLNNVQLDNLSLPGNLNTLTANDTDFGNVVIAGSLTSMVIGNHNLTGTVSANSIGTITNVGPLTGGDIAGNLISATFITKVLTNRITGSVTAGGAIGLLATAQDLDGVVEANGGTTTAVIGGNIDGSFIVHNGNLSMGTLTLARVGGDVTGTVAVDGVLITGQLPTLSVHASGDFLAGASISSSGDLVAKADVIGTDLTAARDLTFAMKAGGLTTAITAGEDVMGDGANGGIVIRGGNLSGQINAGANISTITLEPNTLGITGSLNAGGTIADLTVHFFNGASVTANAIGNIKVEHSGSNGGVSSAIVNSVFTAVTSIGNVTVKQTGGDTAIDQSVFEAQNGGIGAITAETTGTGSAIRGSNPLPTFSAGTSIGAIITKSVTADAISSARFAAVGSIGNVSSSSTDGDAIDGSTFTSTTASIGAVSGASTNGIGIDGSTFQANTGLGTIGGTSVQSTAINNSTFRSVTGAMGAITGPVTNANSSADAIASSNFTAGAAMGAIVGSAQLGSGISNSRFSADGNISTITGTTLNDDPSMDKDGIQDSVFRSGAAIGKITGSTEVDDEGLAGATESEAIDGSVFSAFGSILASEGAAIVSTGDIQGSFFLAGYDIGGNLRIDGLAGVGSDDIKGSTTTPVQIGDVSVASDIVASFFAAGVGTDNAVFGDANVGAFDDFLNALGSTIGNVTVRGVIAGGEGFTLTPLGAFNSDGIGLVTADAIGMSDVDNSTVASVGFDTTFFMVADGSIEGLNILTSTRDQAIGDGTRATVGTLLGFVNAVNESETARSAIGAVQFTATTIGEITASTPNSDGARAIDGRASVAGAFFGASLNHAETGVAIGNITATGVEQVGTVAIEGGFFSTGPLLGQHIGGITTLGNILSSTFSSAGDIANLAGFSGITVVGNILSSSFSAETSIAGDGGINVNLIAGEEGYIFNSSFFSSGNGGAASLGIGNVVVAGTDDDGIGIGFSNLSALSIDPVHMGSVTLSTGSIENTDLSASGNIALAGGINVFGNTVFKDFGIFNVNVNAGGDLGSITVGPSGLAKNAVGTQISSSSFSAVNIAVTDTMGTETPADDLVRAITVHGNNTGDPANRAPAQAGLSIFSSFFVAADGDNTPGVGSIGDILVGQSAGDQAGGGIAFSSFLANLHVGNIKVRMNVTDADEDVSAISNSTFRGQSLEDEIEFGSIGDIVAVINGLPSTKDVIVDSIFNAGPDSQVENLLSMGSITATTQGGGVAVRETIFRADGLMGAINLQTGEVSNDAVVLALFSAFGDIGGTIGNDINVVGNVIDSKFLAGYDVGADLFFDGFPPLSSDEGVFPGDERVNVEPVKINRISINGNLIATDIIVGIDPGDDIFGNTAAATVDAEGNPSAPLPSDDVAASADSKIGTVQVQGGTFMQGNDQKLHSIAAGFIGQFQQPNNVTHKADLPGFLDNGPDFRDVRIQGEPSGAPVFITSRDFAGREVDFNGDGNTDAIIIDSRTNQLKIFLGDGIGGFLTPQVFKVGNAPVSAVIGNFNGDVLLNDQGNATGRPALDIVVLNSLATDGVNTIDLFFANSDGTFSESGHQSVALGLFNKTLTSIAASDVVDATNFNSASGDGFLDLLITNSTDGVLRVLRNTDPDNDGVANGIFVTNPVNNFAVGAAPSSVAVTLPFSLIAPESSAPTAPDLNIGAGIDLDAVPFNAPDAVVANAGSDSVSILFGGNDGDGEFNAAINVAVGDRPLQTLIADVDDDGDIDILTVNFSSNDVTILYNNGLGVFDVLPSVTITVGEGPRSIIANDFDGDGLIDFATANTGDNSVSIVLNTLGGVFGGAMATTVTLTGLPLAITSGRYDGDTDIDLAVTNADNAQAPVVLLNDGAGVFTIAT